VTPLRPLRAVLFDWDGTLVDSADASYRCYERLFASFGIPFDRPRFEQTYSPDWYRTYAAVGLPDESWDEANSRWLTLYAEHKSELLPGAREALERFRAAGLRQGLVTSGDRGRVTRELASLGIEGFFRSVVCAGDAGQRKPHPEGLHLALAGLGASPAEAAYVGDSPEDVQMARAAGVFAVGIPGGFPNREALAASAPDLLAASLDEAAAALVRLAAEV
jgi:HAD superfamily hydrolase (TIGR01549 family)